VEFTAWLLSLVLSNFVWHIEHLDHFGGGLHSQSLDWCWQTIQYWKIYKKYNPEKSKQRNIQQNKTTLVGPGSVASYNAHPGNKISSWARTGLQCINWAWFYVCTNTIQVIRPTAFTGLMTQPTASKHWRRVVSHPDRPQSNQAHLTVLQ